MSKKVLHSAARPIERLKILFLKFFVHLNIETKKLFLLENGSRKSVVVVPQGFQQRREGGNGPKDQAFVVYWYDNWSCGVGLI